MYQKKCMDEISLQKNVTAESSLNDFIMWFIVILQILRDCDVFAHASNFFMLPPQLLLETLI
jgi:hypothetical protein